MGFDTVMMRYTLLAIFLIAVTLLCLADEGEALRKKSRRRRKSVSSKSLGHRHIESQIKHLERKFKSLSSKGCQDGAKGKDGDCNSICSEGFQLTFEDAESNTGRAACCKPGEVVTPTGSCRPDGSKGKFVPPVCYQLKARLRRVINTDPTEPETSVVYLRGFEGSIGGRTYRCDNDGCCSFSGIDLSSVSSIGDTIQNDFSRCGVTVLNFQVRFRYVDMELNELCYIFELLGTSNFDIAGYAAFYGGTIRRINQHSIPRIRTIQ